MANLKTNYKDDVLDTSKNEKRKFRMIQNEDGTVSFEDVTEYIQIGDTFGAADVNMTNEEINALNEGLENCLKSASDGKKTVASAITAQGVSTAADAEFAVMAKNIETVGTDRYNAGYSAGKSEGITKSGSLALGGFWGVQNNGGAYDTSLPCLLSSNGPCFSRSGNTIIVNRETDVTFVYGGNAWDTTGYIEVNINGVNYNRCNISHGNSQTASYKAHCSAGTRISFHIHKDGSGGYSTMALFGVACQS